MTGQSESSAAMHTVTIEAERDAAERLASALEACEQAPLAAIALFESGNGHCQVQALYAEPPDMALLGDLLQAEGGEGLGRPRFERLDEADWVSRSQAARQPVQAARFFVHGAHDRGCARGRPFAIEIDAGLAFGTAHHASTKACLLALHHILRRVTPKHVADIGTGSGILAIAAAKALRAPVLASDNDPLAVGVARDNARRNGVAGFVRPMVAEGMSHPVYRRRQGWTDLVLANLLLRPLWELAPAFGRQLRPGGAAVLSGITADQRGCIEARYRAFGFWLHRRYEVDGWTTLVLFRR